MITLLIHLITSHNNEINYISKPQQDSNCYIENHLNYYLLLFGCGIEYISMGYCIVYTIYEKLSYPPTILAEHINDGL